jgi:hypothetical protein
MSNSAPKPPKQEKQRQKAHNGVPKSLLGTMVAVILGVLTFIGGLAVLWPRVGVTVSDPVDTNDPFSASATVSNTGFLPLHDVNAWFGLVRIVGGVNGATYEGAANYGTRIQPKALEEKHTLTMDDKFTFALNDIISFCKCSGESADIAVIVEYHIPIIGLRLEKIFPYYLRKQGGNYYWYAKTPPRV